MTDPLNMTNYPVLEGSGHYGWGSLVPIAIIILGILLLLYWFWIQMRGEK